MTMSPGLRAVSALSVCFVLGCPAGNVEPDPDSGSVATDGGASTADGGASTADGGSTPAGDAAARPELANIPDVSLSPETREALFQISAHPGCGVDAANLFSNVKEEAWARKPCLFGGSNFLAVHQLAILECIRVAIVGPK